MTDGRATTVTHMTSTNTCAAKLSEDGSEGRPFPSHRPRRLPHRHGRGRSTDGWELELRQLGKKLALALVVSALLITSLSVATPDSVQASQPKVWKIGLEGPLTGSQSDVGIGMLEGAQLAAQQINTAGGVLGRQLQIVPIDDAADPTVGV